MNTEEREVEVQAGGIVLGGSLAIPADARGLILFAHGSGSSRHSPRNRYVAGQMQEMGLGTLLMDLLTQAEEGADMQTAHFRFNVGMLADRLVQATDWLCKDAKARELPVGFFGSSTGAAAALIAAAERPAMVHAIVSRGGRPDLASLALPYVQAATLLIVGGNDVPVIGMNREAMKQLRCENRLEIVPGAGHLFEEQGALEQVARLAGEWFLTRFERAHSASGCRPVGA